MHRPAVVTINGIVIEGASVKNNVVYLPNDVMVDSEIKVTYDCVDKDVGQEIEFDIFRKTKNLSRTSF
jgi:hypothetical protein